MHMDDCRKRAELEMEHDKRQLEDAVKFIRSPVLANQDINKDIEALSARKADLDHIKVRLANLGTFIGNLQNEVGIQKLNKTSQCPFHPLTVDW